MRSVPMTDASTCGQWDVEISDLGRNDDDGLRLLNNNLDSGKGLDLADLTCTTTRWTRSECTKALTRHVPVHQKQLVLVLFYLARKFVLRFFFVRFRNVRLYNSRVGQAFLALLRWCPIHLFFLRRRRRCSSAPKDRRSRSYLQDQQ